LPVELHLTHLCCIFIILLLSCDYLLIKFLDSTGTVRGNDWSSIASHILHSRTYQHLLASMTKKVGNIYYTLFLTIFKTVTCIYRSHSFYAEETMCLCVLFKGASIENKTWLINYLTPWSRVHLEKLLNTQLVKKYPTFYGTWRFMTVFTITCHWSLSWARCIQFTPSYSISLNVILPYMPRSSEWSLPFGISNQNIVCINKIWSGIPS